MERWKTIPAFPRYEVSDQGRVRNALTGRIMQTKVNQFGVVGVGLMEGGTQYHRSVPLLVATLFKDGATPQFDTPINLDGDRHNNAASNLMWRPRWFAVQYNQQFRDPYDQPITEPVFNEDTRETYQNSFHAAVMNGLLERDLVLAILNRTYVWPSYHIYSVL